MRGSFRRSSLFLGATVLLCTALLICNLGGLPPAEASPRLQESSAPEDPLAELVVPALALTITTPPSPVQALSGSDAESGGGVLPVGSNGTITITLSANPTSIVANGTSTSTLTAALEGVSDGTVVTFTTTAGTFDGSDTITDTASGGSAQAILTSATVAQTATVTAEVDAVTDTTVVTFTAGALDHFAVSVPSTGIAGVSFTTVITALDAYSNTVTSFTNTATLTTTNGGTISPTMTGAFNAGVWNGQVSLTTAGTGRTVIAQYGSAQGTGYIDIQHGVAQSVNLTPKDQSRTAGQTITYDLDAADGYGNTWDVTASSEFTITWDAGGSWAGPTYTTAKAGSWTVTGTYNSLNDTTGLTVNPSDPQTVAVTADPTSLVANGTDTATITATVRDTYENAVADGTNVTFQASLGSFPTTPYVTTTTNGVAVATLTAGTTAGTSYITATAGSAEGYATVELVPGPLDHVVVSPAGADLHPYDTQQFTAQGFDQYDNEIADPGLSWAVVNGGGTIDANGLFTAGTTIAVFPDTVAAGDGTITGTASVTVTNQAPTAVISGPTNGPEGGSLTWDASSSTDPENDALTYAWDFGDGSTAGNVITVTHTYTDNANYTLTLTVTDAYDAWDSVTQTVSIYNVAPTATFNAPTEVDEGDDIALSLTSPFDPSSADTAAGFQYAFDCGNGYGSWSATSTASCPTTDDGSVMVGGKIRDKDLAETEYTATVTVNNVAPTASASNDGPVAEGSPVTVTASQSDPGDDTFTYSFDWTNDSTWDIVDQMGVTATHVYADDGDYTVGVRVRDDDGGVGLTTTVVSVYNVTPTAVISGPVSGDEGSALTWDASLSTDPGDDVLTYAWDFGDGSAPGSGLSVIHTYTDNADYVLSLTVTDDEGAADTVTQTVSIANVDPVADAGGPYTGTAGVPVLFDASGSYDVGAGDTLTYEWDFDDDGFYDDGVGETTYYTWTVTSYPDPYTIGLQVTDDDGGMDTVTTTVNISPGPLDRFRVGTTGPGTAGELFPTTITPRDEYDNILRDWNTTVALSTTNGGEINPTQVAGSAFVYGVWDGNVSLTRAGDDRTVVVSYDGKTGTGYIDIDPASLDYIRVEDVGGSEFTTATLVVRGSLTVYARGYDQYDNLVGSQTVTWTGTGPADGYLAPVSGSSTTFTPEYSGTATIQATYSPAITDTTGSITVTAPVLSLTKQEGVDPVEAGALLTYTIIYSNTGNAAATNLVITETLDNNLSFVSSEPTPSGGTGHVRTWTISQLDPDGPHQIVITASVESPLPNGTVLTSTTQMNSDQTDPVVASTVTTTVHSQPVLSITKIDIIDPVDAGDEIAYRIEYSNSGNENASHVVITDHVPISTTFNRTAGTPAGVHANGVVTWTIGTLNAGSSNDVYLYVTVDSPLPAGTVITNTGYQIDSDQTAPVVGADVTTTIKSPALKVSLAATPDPVDAGQQITYTLTYTNVGDGAAHHVNLWNELPDDPPGCTSLVSASGGYVYANGVVTWSIGTLDSGEEGQQTLVVQVTSPLTDGTSLLDIAHIDSVETEVSGDSLVTTVRSRPELHIAKQAGQSVVEAGALLTYTITYSNTGNANATGVVITDTYDAHVNFVGASPMPDDGDNVWELGLLAGEGGNGTIVVTVTVDVPLTDTLPLTNLVEMTGREVAEVYSATAVAEVNSAPILGISIQDAPDPIHAGQTITYTIAYSNTGNANATNTVITATWDSHLGSISANPAPTSGNNVWHLGQLDGLNGYGTIVVTATVNGPLPPDAVLDSSVRLGCSQLAGTVSDFAETEVNAVDLELIAGYDDNTVYPGKWVTYTLNYANHGDVPATGVVLTATRPAYTDYRGSGWSTTGGTVYTRSLGTLGVGASGSVQFVVSIQAADGGGGSQVLPSGLTQLYPTFSIGDDHSFGLDSNATDNESSSFIGVPDLVVESITVSPETIMIGTPVTFTVRIRNQGTGPAWNPNGKLPFYVNVFLDQDPPPSYPSSAVSPDVWGVSPPIYPGQVRDVQLSYSGFSAMGEHIAYAKVDNYYYPGNPTAWQRFSLVPESDESNNVFGPVGVEMGQGTFNVYVPIVMRNYH